MTKIIGDDALPKTSIAQGGDKIYTSLMPHQIIEKCAQEVPSAIAAAYHSQTITYEKLNCRANQLANTLLSNGAYSGDRCAVCLTPSLEILIAILAIHKIGAAYVPLDPDAPSQRLEFILNDAGPDIVIYHKKTERVTPLQKFSTLDIDAIAFGQSQIDSTNPNICIKDSTIANIFYTSGTTGYPKGVLATYKNYRHYINAANDRFSMTPSTVMPAIAKFTFSISLFELIAPLAAGGTVRLIDRDAVLTPSHVINELKLCTMAHIGPSLWLRVLTAMEANDVEPSQFEHFQHASSGGDLVPPELLQRLSTVFPKAEIYVIYGCSEISCMATTFFVDRQLPITKTYVGRPFCNTSIAVINYHTQEPTTLGDKGEICICSDGVASAYIGSNETFEMKIITLNGQRFYKTGDIGRLTDDRELEMFGREDFQVKANGVRIELSEIDYHLRKAPNIEQAISMFWRSNEGENKIYAYVTNPLTPKQISQAREYLQNNLMEQMQPKSFIYIESLPLNINLKVDRKALPKPSQNNIIREATYGAAKTKTQKQLLEIWQSLIEQAEIGIDDDFFYSGGSSLQGVDLMEKIEHNFKARLSLNTLLSNRTIRELAQVIDTGSSDQTADRRSILIKRTDSDANVFFIHDGNGEAIPYYSMSKALDTKHTIYSITPPHRGRAPISESSFEVLSKLYADEILRVQSSGPLIIGGLCIGGYIAYCVAAELEQRGHTVSDIVLFDSHYIDATPRPYAQQQRKTQVKSLIVQLKANLFNPSIAFQTFLSLAKKLLNYCSYQCSNTVKNISHRARIATIALIKYFPKLADTNLPFPDVDSVLRQAEKKYRRRPKCNANLILFRATKNLDTLKHLNINDTPYCHYYEGDDLGWSKIHGSNLKIYPVAAGHSTLLTPPYSDEIAVILAKIIP